MNTFLIIAAVIIFISQLGQATVLDELKKKIAELEFSIKLLKENQTKSAEDELLKNPLTHREEDFTGTYKDD